MAALGLAVCSLISVTTAVPAAPCVGNCAIAAAFKWLPDAEAPAQPTERVELTLALSHDESVTRALAERLMRVSDPESESYGEHVLRSELPQLVPPKHGAIELVTQWGTEAGATVRSAGSGDLLVLSLTVSQAETALGVRISAHKHLVTGERILRTLDDLSVPIALQEHVALVHGLSTWPQRSRSSEAQDSATIGSPAVTPALIKTLYNITDVHIVGSGDAPAQAVAEFQNQLYAPSDLTAFEEQFLPDLPPQAARRQSPNSTCSPTARPVPGMPSLCSSEAALDIQYIIASGRGIPTDFFLQPQGKNGFGGDLLAWAAETVADTSLGAPVVWSVSYGEGVNGGIGGRQAVDTVHRMDVEMQKLGIAGVSVLFASGDSGVYNRNPLGVLEFHPSFPACLPSVTAVGATELTAQRGGPPQELSGVSFSGGGFTPAKYFTRDNSSTWQIAAVERYLNSGVTLPPKIKWDRTGRAIPDISAVGVNFQVVLENRTSGVSGTSASTPLVAGLFSMINAQRAKMKKSSLGFLNPFLYKAADADSCQGGRPCAFRDIVKGYNNGGGLDSLFAGFHAAPGWDPVTGIGTPNYEVLKQYALSLP